MTAKLLEWRDAYALGLPEIDHEHQQMIAEINRLHESLDHNATADDVVDCLGEILAHISAHFALEEKNMRAAAYDGLAEHKADHERLLDELHTIASDVADRGRYDSAVLAARLDAWFMKHFGSLDARLHRALRVRR
ncbi:MAG: hemerythrin family protein [Gammaproteobacteria bacterium]|nr:hemerythrin family protein [Gammaproteobacteria bacterium]